MHRGAIQLNVHLTLSSDTELPSAPVLQSKHSGAFKRSLSELRKQINSWWIITCSSWRGRIKKIFKPLSLLLLTNFCKEFLFPAFHRDDFTHNSLQGQCCWGKGWHRVSAALTWISLSHHEPAPSETIPRPSSTWKQARIKQEKSLRSISSPGSSSYPKKPRSQTCEEVTGWQNSLSDSKQSNFYK